MRRTILILFSCALVGAALVPALSSAGRPAALERRAAAMSADGVVAHRVTESRAEMLRYWTSKRMREARPTGLILGASDRRRIGAPPAPSGPEISIEPMAAEPSVALTRSVRRAKGSGVSPPFVRDEIVNTADAPFRTHGKVYFTLDGSDYVCSGTVITSEDENVVITAGHCVYEPSTGHFATNFMFRPGFRSGTAPFGSWTASELFTTAGWQSEDIFYDVGMALMEPLSGTIHSRVRGVRLSGGTALRRRKDVPVYLGLRVQRFRRRRGADRHRL